MWRAYFSDRTLPPPMLLRHTLPPPILLRNTLPPPILLRHRPDPDPSRSPIYRGATPGIRVTPFLSTPKCKSFFLGSNSFNPKYVHFLRTPISFFQLSLGYRT